MLFQSKVTSQVFTDSENRVMLRLLEHLFSTQEKKKAVTQLLELQSTDKCGKTEKVSSPMQFPTIEGFGVEVNTCRISCLCTVYVDFSSQFYPGNSQN